MPEKPEKPGPDAERLKIDSPEGWEQAVDKALQKPKPDGGWPDPTACDHSNMGREVLYGQKTGDYRCRVCNEVFTPEEAKAIRAKLEEAKDGD